MNRHSRYFHVSLYGGDNSLLERLFDSMVKCKDATEKEPYEIYYDPKCRYFYLLEDSERGWVIEEIRDASRTHDKLLEEYEELIGQ